MLKTRLKDRRTTLKERMAQEWTIPWHEGATVSGFAFYSTPSTLSGRWGSVLFCDGNAVRGMTRRCPPAGLDVRASQWLTSTWFFFHYVQYLP